MKRKIVVGITGFVALAVVGWLVVGGLSTNPDIQRIDNLSEEVMERRFALYNQVITSSCECGTERDETGEEGLEQCLDERLIPEAQIESASRCFRASATSLETAPPEGLDDYLDCASNRFDGVEQCFADVEQYERCSMEALEQIQECMFELVGMHCEDIDDDTEDWLTKLGEEAENAGCADDIGAGLSADQIGDGLRQHDVDLDEIYDRWPPLEVDYDAISVDGQPVMELTRGELNLESPHFEPLEPILEAYEEFEEIQNIRVALRSLISYGTATHVLNTVVGGLEAGVDIDVEAGPSHSEVWRRQFEPRDRLDDAAPMEDDADGDPSEQREPLDLAISISADGFYISARGRMMSPIDGCQESGATICLLDGDIDTMNAFEQARQAAAQGDERRAAQYFERGLEAYDFRRLYNEIVELHREHPDEGILRLSAHRAFPMGIVDRVMDVVAYRLEESHYDDREQFRRAFEQGPAVGVMFGDPAFAIYE